MTNEEMFNKNINIAYKIANRYLVNYPNEYEDIKQIALLGLWKAVLNYDENKGHKFSTFAYPCVSNSINMYLRHNKKHENNISIHTQLTEDNLTLEDTIKDDCNLEEDTCNKIEVDKAIAFGNDLRLYGRDKIVWNLYLEGYTQEAIGKQMGLSQANISRLLHKIKMKIANLYSGRESYGC